MGENWRKGVGAILVAIGICAGLPLEPWWRIAIVVLQVYIGLRMISG